MAIAIDDVLPAVRMVRAAANAYWYDLWSYANYDEDQAVHPLYSSDLRMQVAVSVLRNTLGHDYVRWICGDDEYDSYDAPTEHEYPDPEDSAPCVRSNPYGRQHIDVGYDRMDYKMCRRRAKHGEQKRRGTRLRDKRSPVKYLVIPQLVKE